MMLLSEAGPRATQNVRERFGGQPRVGDVPHDVAQRGPHPVERVTHEPRTARLEDRRPDRPFEIGGGRQQKRRGYAMPLHRPGETQQPLAAEDETVGIRVSIGVTTLTAADPQPEACMSRADTALYRAKQHGRNREEFIEDDREHKLA